MKPYVDGYWGKEIELTVVPRTEWPFIENPTPDVISRAYDRDYLVRPISFEPKIAALNSWQNLLLRSQQFANASWTKTELTATDDQGTAPDGLPTLGKVVETTNNAEHRLTQAVTVLAAPVEISVWAKAGLTRRLIRLQFTDSAAAVFSAYFDFESGVPLSPAAGVAAFVDVYPGNMVRCRIRFTPAAGAGSLRVNLATAIGTVSYAGSTANGAYLWGAQVMHLNGIHVPPYVSTTDAARTAITPIVEKTDALAFLARESQPASLTSESETIRRNFARVPLTQVVPSFLRLNKPSPSGSLPRQLGSYVVAQPDAASIALDAYLSQVVGTDSGADLGVGGALTGGTYTLSFAGDTTIALAYNATSGAVQAALNALASVIARGGVAVTGDYLSGFTIVFSNIELATYLEGGLTNTGGSGFQKDIYSGSGNGFVQGITITALPIGVGSITGGSFAIIIFGQSTAAIPYSASAGTVQSALNALSNVAARGGVTILPGIDPIHYTPGQIGLAFGFSYPAITVNAGSLLPVGATGAAVRVDNNNFFPSVVPGKTQLLTFSGPTVGDRIITTPVNHGITNADAIFAKAGDTFFLIPPGAFDVTALDEITFDSASGPIAVSLDSIVTVGKRIRSGYTPGSFVVRCKRTSTFYLPGWTPGINTSDDITPPVYQGDPDVLLQLIFAGAGTINYEVGELEKWRGRIFSLTVVTILASDL